MSQKKKMITCRPHTLFLGIITTTNQVKCLFYLHAVRRKLASRDFDRLLVVDTLIHNAPSLFASKNEMLLFRRDLGFYSVDRVTRIHF